MKTQVLITIALIGLNIYCYFFSPLVFLFLIFPSIFLTIAGGVELWRKT